MTNTTLALLASAIGSLIMAGVQGAETVRYVMTDGMITGTGTVTGAVVAGETVPVQWVLHKRTDCAGTNARVWNGEGGFHMVEPVGPTALPKTDKPRGYTVPTGIPSAAPIGPLSLTIRGQYNCPDLNPHDFTLGPVLMEVVGK